MTSQSTRKEHAMPALGADWEYHEDGSVDMGRVTVRPDGSVSVGCEDEALAQDALRDMGVYAPKVLERRSTKPGERPDGDGWECIASGVCPDRATGAWWLWQRFVEEGS